MTSEELEQKLIPTARSEEKVQRRKTSSRTKGLVFLMGLGLTATLAYAKPQNTNWTRALTNPFMQNMYTWLVEWVHPTNPAKGHFIPVDDEIGGTVPCISQADMYEIRLPKNASFYKWIEKESFEYAGVKYNFQTHLSLYLAIFNRLNEKRHPDFNPADPKAWMEGRLVVIADLNHDGMIFGLNLEDYIAKGKAMHISIGAINRSRHTPVKQKRMPDEQTIQNKKYNNS
ncbi:MAG: hypothetical protein KKF46_03210 [Nanoarchaeota archaeon]|nr:hypothetical protein [Nanoarchaeota archaeon]MBU1321342.1 hypothetical protein [Nanoarchaeota archaeon]MBU1597265.1 hypothetical protein [Nanoarchaeota archaeon]MBU2441479.1 hypothetical protein [Nanoarchaeota archaeon]